MTYNPRRQAMPRRRPLPKNPPRINAWDVLGLLVIMAIGAWFLWQFSAAILLTSYGRWTR